MPDPFDENEELLAPDLETSEPAAPPAPPAPINRSLWTRPWVQLKFFTFQPHIFPRMLGEVSQGIRAGDWVSVYDKPGRLCGVAAASM